MKITEYKILDEANPELLKYISGVDQKASSLAKKLGIKPKTSNEVEQSEYEYNITSISFILKSTTSPNMFPSRKGNFSYAFYDNMLHIYGSRSLGDQLKIYFDYDNIDLKELKAGSQYKVDRVEGSFQTLMGKESFDTFILLTPNKILKSIKIQKPNAQSSTGQNNTNNLKPNADVDITIINKKDNTEIKGLVHLEEEGGKYNTAKNTYKLSNNNIDITFKTTQPLINKSNVKYDLVYVKGVKNGSNLYLNKSQMVVNKLKYTFK
jgi:hypothetical protein